MFVSEIFDSFHGECNGHHQGMRVSFVRISGCNLRCPYCDTKETWDQLHGENLDILTILHKLKKLGNKYICITGGEPLIYKPEVISLLRVLWESGFRISVETNGTIDITPFVRYVDSFVIDYKIFTTPSEIEPLQNNYKGLRKSDVIKFVVKSKEEAIQAFHYKMMFEPYTDAIFAFSPVLPCMDASGLIKLMKEHKVRDAVLSLQIHKMIDFK